MIEYEDLRKAYKEKEHEIQDRLSEFKKLRLSKFKRLFEELVFCLLTPMSKATNCNSAVNALKAKGLLMKGSEEEIARELKGVRFAESKARYIVEARELFTAHGGYDLARIIRENARSKIIREWLVKNVKGLGYKEASHFLRNVGVGFDLAILDRHVLRNLWRYGVIGEIPKTLTKKDYLEIEKKMRKFSRKVGIEMGALDLLFWSMETGEIFK